MLSRFQDSELKKSCFSNQGGGPTSVFRFSGKGGWGVFSRYFINNLERASGKRSKKALDGGKGH